MKSAFPDLLKRLNEAGVEYVLVGGMAAIFHGAEFANTDCDIVVDFNEDNLSLLARTILPFSPRYRNAVPPQPFNEMTAWESSRETIYLDTNAGVLDCHSKIKAVGGLAECKGRSVEVDFGEFTIRVLSREALIAAKKAMGRPKDLQTVEQLEIGGELDT